MNHKYILAYLLLSLLLSGCVSFYRYRSDGDLTYASGVKHHAVLYWYGEEGHLWYGKRYAQTDSSLQMRVCKVGSKTFVLKDNRRLELPSRDDDLRIMELDAEGRLQAVTPPMRLPGGANCGEILLHGKAVTTRTLTLVKQNPSVAILCKGINRPERYPQAQIYSFGSISRIKASNQDRKAPDPCVVP